MQLPEFSEITQIYSTKCARVQQLRQFQRDTRLEDFSGTAEKSKSKPEASSRVFERLFLESDLTAAKIQSTVQQTGNISSYETAHSQETRETWLLDDTQVSTQASQAMSLEDAWMNLGMDPGMDPFMTLWDNYPDTLIAMEEEETSPLYGGDSMPTSDTAPRGKKVLIKKSDAKTTTEEKFQNGDLLREVQLVSVAQDNENAKPIKPEQVPQFMNCVWSDDNQYENQSDEMRTVNPHVVEGFAFDSSSDEMIEIEVPVNAGQVQAYPDLLTSVWESVYEQPEETTNAIPEDSCPLLKMVLDETIEPDSEEFKSFVSVVPGDLETLDIGDLIGPSTSSTNVEVKQETHEDGVADHVTIVKRGRGRPRLPRPENEPPRRPRGRPPTAATVADVLDYDSSSALSSEEKKAHKYRRMRDLNNAASKRCRLNRKRKMGDMESDVSLLSSKNLRLQIEVQQLEEMVEKYKQAIFRMVEVKKNKIPAPAPVKPEVPVPSELEPSEFSFDDLLN